MDDQVVRCQLLEEWFNTPQGVDVGKAFANEIAYYQDRIYGKTLLQIGSFGNNVWLQSLRFLHKWCATAYYAAENSSLVSSLNQLPIDRHSIDCIVAPFSNELFYEEGFLVEMDRILKPMGYLVLFGINPWSIWGIAARVGKLTHFSKLSKTFVSSFKVKRIMGNLGYHQCAHSSFYYIPPVANRKIITHLEFLNEVGKMVWPFPAGFYCLILQKNQPCPTGFAFQKEKELLLNQKNTVSLSGRWLRQPRA